MNCGGILSVISSPESASGATLCAGPDGPMTAQSGQAPARASLSARQAEDAGLLTSGIFGLIGSTSSRSGDLQSSLESRLRARTALVGSILYRMTWKVRVTPSGRAICALRASPARISDSACTLSGWPTTTRDWKDGANPDVNVPLNALLGRQVWLAGWPSPTVGNANGSQMAKDASATGKRPDGSKATVSLPQVATFAGWPTPLSAPDSPASHGQSSGQFRRAMAEASPSMDQPLRLCSDGTLLTGSSAGMDAGGRLNPAHSRWLIRLPPEWDACAPTETASMLKQRRASSKL